MTRPAAGRTRPDDSIVRQENGVYQLHPDLPLTTDAAAFEEAVARADASPPGSVEEGEALAAADGLYAGPYLEGVDAVWVVARRAGLARAHARVLHRLAERALIADPVAIAAETPQIEMPDANGAAHSRLKPK